MEPVCNAHTKKKKKLTKLCLLGSAAAQCVPALAQKHLELLQRPIIMPGFN